MAAIAAALITEGETGRCRTAVAGTTATDSATMCHQHRIAWAFGPDNRQPPNSMLGSEFLRWWMARQQWAIGTPYKRSCRRSKWPENGTPNIGSMFKGLMGGATFLCVCIYIWYLNHVSNPLRYAWQWAKWRYEVARWQLQYLKLVVKWRLALMRIRAWHTIFTIGHRATHWWQSDQAWTHVQGRLGGAGRARSVDDEWDCQVQD